jgi:hypothetical protein
VNRHRLRILLITIAVLAPAALLAGCAGDHSPTVERDGRVMAPSVLPR